MASPIQCVVEGQFLTGSAAQLYLSPTSTFTQVVKLSCSNSDTVSRAVTLYIVPSGGTVGSANVTTSARALLPGETFNSPNEYAHVLNPGDTIWGFADAPGKVSVRVSAILAS